jgi:HK97 family phage prohead protease
MDTIYKIIENCEVKKVGERQYEFTASTADMDRDGEVISVDGWDLKNFKKNPVIMFAHNYNTLPIGKATKIGVKDGKLMNVVEFPPEGTYEFADTVARLVDAGYLKTQSVGFIPKKWEDGDWTEEDGKGSKPRRTYTKQELLEISIVPVPSNPNALMNAVKEGVITQKQFKSITEPEEEKPKASKTSQEQIVDELDYLELMLQENGVNDKAKDILQRIAESYLDAIQDATIPVKDTTKESLTLLSEIIKEQIGG